MHLPWKKMKKNTRLSQMLSDSINRRRKSGGSPLVVETGFPASLVDLFVKNKERLKKPSKKKNNDNKIWVPPPLEKIDKDFDDDDDNSLPLILCSSPSSSPFHPRHNAGDASRGVIGSCECKDREEGEEGVDGNRVLVAILRMFLVVVLVLCTRTFVVGITMSAFVLVFLECVGKHLCILSRPCSWVKIKLRLIMNFRKGNVEEVDERREESLLCLPSSGLKNQDQDQGIGNRTREIEPCVVSRNLEIECERERIDGGVKTKLGEYLNSEQVGFDDEEKICEKGKLRARKSRRDRMKLKMKELVPKKLRTSRSRSREVKIAEGVVADNVAISEKEEDPNGELSEFRSDDSDFSSMSREIDDVSYSSDKLVAGNMIREGEESETKKNSGYVVLVLIVLVGLIGGRILALVLALSWCLMTKAGGKLRRQYIEAAFPRVSS